MLFLFACSFLFTKSHKFSIILRSGDWAAQVSDGCDFEFCRRQSIFRGGPGHYHLEKYVLVFNRIDISVYRCYCTRTEPRNAPPYHHIKLGPWFFVNKIGSPTFTRFPPHVHSFIMANHHLTFIRKFNSFPIGFNRQYPLFPGTMTVIFFYLLLLSKFCFLWTLRLKPFSCK